MKIIKNMAEWMALRKAIPANLSLGFVPTMGNLHKGHASLYKLSRSNNDQTIASLFINPTQFNQPDDFKNYPRTLDDDLNLLEKEGVNYCLLPDEQSMYEQGYRYQIQENDLCKIMEGKQRPGHFTGMLTIVMKLLNLAKPQHAYFGEKDFQQYLLIRDMARDFFMDIDIVPCPTIREESGLAYSSRNNRLNPAEKKLAADFARLFHQKKSCQEIRTNIEQLGIHVEYVEEYANRRFTAVQIGDVRLIDNYAIPFA